MAGADLAETNFTEESFPQEIKEKIQALRRRSEPVNILVIGPTGAGKSTLVNALLGDIVAEEGYGASSSTTEMDIHKGEFLGVKIRAYDTVGFNDTRGRSGVSIIEEMAKADKFDLILICLRMDSRFDSGVQRMFAILSSTMHREAWKRTVVVLTFANSFCMMRHFRRLKGTEKRAMIVQTIEEIQCYIFTSESTGVDKEIFSDVPFCIAGDIDERELPTTNDWLLDLWITCFKRIDKARSYRTYSLFDAAKSIAAGIGNLITGGARAFGFRATKIDAGGMHVLAWFCIVHTRHGVKYFSKYLNTFRVLYKF